MDIDNIILQIMSLKLKPKFTYGLNIDINTDKNRQFEIMTLMLLRLIEEQVLKNIKSINVREMKTEILKNIFVSKLYLNSCGIELKYEILEKKNISNYNLSNKCSFYLKNKYNFDFCIIKNIYKNGKIYEINYNMKGFNSFYDLFIVVKIKNHYFKLQLDLLKK